MSDERTPGPEGSAGRAEGAGEPVGPGAEAVGPGIEPVGPGAEPASASPGAPAVDDHALDPAVPVAPVSDGDASLLALVDRMASILDRSELAELEVEAGGTALLLRKPVALAAPVAAASAPARSDAEAATPTAPQGGPSPAASSADAEPRRPSVKAPLTGIYYGSPSPGATPYVSVGDHVSVGQVIGLIEAMKLFNEIKSDLAGRVVRIVAENGALVKAKQPLVEIEP